MAAAGGSGLVDEVVVVDDGSIDDTAAAREAGARVLPRSGDRGRQGPGHVGRPGRNHRGPRGLPRCRRREHHRRLRLRAARTASVRDDVVLVKGFYERPLDGQPTGGGRVTELVARPLIELLFPELGRGPPALGRGDRRLGGGPGKGRVRRRLRRGAGPADRRGPRSGWAPSPRSTSACASTATGRWPSSAPRRWTSCVLRSTACRRGTGTGSRQQPISRGLTRAHAGRAAPVA